MVKRKFSGDDYSRATKFRIKGYLNTSSSEDESYSSTSRSENSSGTSASNFSSGDEVFSSSEESSSLYEDEYDVPFDETENRDYEDFSSSNFYFIFFYLIIEYYS